MKRLPESPTLMHRGTALSSASVCCPALGRACALGALLIALAAAGQIPAPNVAPPPASYSVMQIDQMLAPIALYPDELLAQILMAATYPLEIVQADRWLQDPEHAALRSAQLVAALQLEPWDSSVKSLVAFPQVLGAMDNNLEWTEALGDAFVAQQADVMDRVQQLRARAQAARTLISTPQQVVSADDQAIVINPSGPDTVYVPEYDPNVVYGNWPYYDNPPDDFELPDYAPGGFLAFAILAPLWGWNSWDWRHHRIGLLTPPAVRSPAIGPQGRGPTWHHDPMHRHGVPYRIEAARTAEAESGSARVSAFRGYAPAQSASGVPERSEARGAAALPRAGSPRETVSRQSSVPAQRFLPEFETRPEPPALESFGHGAQVQIQEQRGASSRASVPAGTAHPGGARERR